MIKKITSRKFIMSLIADLVGIVTLIASEEGNDLQVIASIVLIIISTVAYIVSEARVDAAAVATRLGLTASEIIKLVEIIRNNDDPLISKNDETSLEETTTEKEVETK